MDLPLQANWRWGRVVDLSDVDVRASTSLVVGFQQVSYVFQTRRDLRSLCFTHIVTELLCGVVLGVMQAISVLWHSRQFRTESIADRCFSQGWTMGAAGAVELGLVHGKKSSAEKVKERNYS